MSAPRGQHNSDRQAERFALYAKLRDDGNRPVDAGREAGVSDGTWQKYERAYCSLRGLPRKRTEVWR